MSDATKDEDSTMMPVWLDDCHMDPAWLARKTGLPIKSCSVKDISNATRRGTRVRDGATLLLSVEYTEPNDCLPWTLVMKQVPESGRPLSQHLGLARESLFYEDLAPQLEQGGSNAIVPKIHSAQGDMATGNKCVVMESLSNDWVDSGIFFGPGNPNNWDRDLAAMLSKCAIVPRSFQVAETTFAAMAKVHGTFWKDANLLKDDCVWLRGHTWLQGQGRDSWEASQQCVRDCWSKYCKKEKEESDTSKLLKWDSVVKDATTKAMKGISWEKQLERLHVNGHWTLVHGDFWPGNVMYKVKQDESTPPEIRLLDWEMTGLGSGPQDLGQYILSNMDPIERKACEKQLIRTYYQELCKSLNDKHKVSWEYCWSEYQIGGVERWLWFLVYFLGQEGMLEWAQFFHNQIAAFMNDHGLTAHDIVQPRP